MEAVEVPAVRKAHSPRTDRAYDDDEAYERLPDRLDERGREPLPLTDIARAAMRRLAELTGRQPSGVTLLEPADDGWAVEARSSRTIASPRPATSWACTGSGCGRTGRWCRCAGSGGIRAAGPTAGRRRDMSVARQPSLAQTAGGHEPANLGDILERVLDRGIVIVGDIRVSLLDIELLTLKLRLVVASVDTARQMGIDWWEHDPWLSSSARAPLQRGSSRDGDDEDELEPGEHG